MTDYKLTKSGSSKNDRQPVQVITQESELIKVKYDVDPTNSRAVLVNGLGVLNDYMASEDLNECVSALLRKQSKAAFDQHATALANAYKASNISRTTAKRNLKAEKRTVPRVIIRRRIKGTKQGQRRLRKNTTQNKILVHEFKKNPIWSQAKIQELHERLGLKRNQIYKWNWDMRRKLPGDHSKIEVNDNDLKNHFVLNEDESGSNLNEQS